MKRLTIVFEDGSWAAKGRVDDVALRLAAIEDVLGDDYELDRLRELVEADRDGRCVVLPKDGMVYYIPAFKSGPEADVYRYHLGQKLAEIAKGREIIPYEKRYPEMKQITYEGRKQK